ncbi:MULTISPECIES: 4-(cytidine 5'-diphospho)-2-C-methyl-D-erythritol kinase [unclassified Ectothiorhodospira]|uniref:4-(cytidine 5'-diphospho)-2-C-methyl-D-erythritol kinase n=1 Tax=unclassified Ectothiorhodospira TaxID=2684909 RepID=UPI001EE886C4|nr:MULTISPECIES: 4-(cytidine 5'-diphospho)-2-C-methyl-D-erythritol kinase [unclassified Ectothiorhodospira]MCG5516655.1 4-(cytidine 5'-diphospho)-2-C-methyl-D-erythritol kinase [Ectothiorhodospira sp. 9100]MCG5519573.1 4-(cytidine 5'-diphospho)-2-C-methyl-D-erythritol kinase [Ectothiorhodospira sp. 9905]
MNLDAWKGWPAPAKLNLFLHITGRRPDGYHALQTVFQFLSHGDVLDFEPLPGNEVRPAHALEDVAPEDDLTVRAARRLKQATGYGDGTLIRVRKVLPMGGGLGGGSSDAATTLVALNHLWGTGLSLEDLAELGLTLGADVPIFVHGRAAWAEGVGECFEPIDLPESWYLVIHPGVHVSTGAVFGDPGLTRNCELITIADFTAGRAGNVCEPIVCKHYPAVAEALVWLEQQGVQPRMTGTGSCVFAAFAEEDAARDALGRLPAAWQGFVAQGHNRSALQDRMDRA